MTDWIIPIRFRDARMVSMFTAMVWCSLWERGIEGLGIGGNGFWILDCRFSIESIIANPKSKI
jgi:hypothetical protein